MNMSDKVLVIFNQNVYPDVEKSFDKFYFVLSLKLF